MGTESFVLPPELAGRLALRPRELARVLGVGVNAAYQLVHRKDFPAVRVGSSFVIPVSELRRWLREQTGTPGGDAL